MRKVSLRATASAFAISLALAGTAGAAGFVNGGFEDGNANGWTVGGGSRASVDNATLTPALILPGGALYNAGIATSHSSIISASYTDPHVPANLLGSTVYSGNYSWRVEDTTTGGYASVISQRVNNYTDTDIFFAWKAVLEGAHGPLDAATLIIKLTDLTTGTDLITRQYNAADNGSGVDARFSTYSNNFYTPQWQIEQLSIGPGLLGHDFLLSVLAADCQPTGHWGYVYLDGFGSVIPPVDAPEPAALGLLGVAMLGLASARRRRRS